MKSLPAKNNTEVSKISNMIDRPWIKYGLFIIALLIALFLYTFHINSDLYGDEVGQTYRVITSENFWANIKDPSMCHPPLFFIFAKGFYELFGEPWSMRIPSLLFSLGTIIIISLLAKRILGPEYFLPSAWLSAFSPFLLEFAAEGRAYGMLIFFSVALIWSFFEFLQCENLKNMALLILISILGALTHYFFWFLFIFIGIYYLIYRRLITRYAWGAVGIASLILLPIAYNLFFIHETEFTKYLQVSWTENYFSIPNFIARLAVALTYGYSTFHLPNLDPGRNFTFSIIKDNLLLIILVFISFTGFAYAYIRLILDRTKWIGFLSLGILIPLMLGIMAGNFGFYLIREKHLSVVWVCFFFLILLGFRYLIQTKAGRVIITSHFAIILISITHFTFYPNEYTRRMDWTGINRTLQREMTDSDVILFYGSDLKDLSLGKMNILDGNVKRINIKQGKADELPITEFVKQIDKFTKGKIFLINNETDRHIYDPHSEIIHTLKVNREISERRFGHNLILYGFKLKQ